MRVIERRPQLNIGSTVEHKYRRTKFIIIGSLLIGLLLLRIISGHVSASGIPEIMSGVSGSCIEDSNSVNNNSVVYIRPCDGSNSQVWSLSGLYIKHNNDCLTTSSENTDSNILASICNNEPSQLWLKDKEGFYNPNSQLCLSNSNGSVNSPLKIESCNNLSSPNEIWSVILPGGSKLSNSYDCKNLTSGQVVACNAENEWVHWQNGANHESLLTAYTDGNAYEEWCADFVSYVYKESGQPLNNGERNNWDEYDANSIQNDGFKIEDPSTYTPKPGDIAYFTYNGGHVEIVISGGKTPTFIYGDSGTTDPTTGNGDMASNTLTSYLGEGQLEYYLTPSN